MKRVLLLWLFMAIGVVHSFAQTKLITGKVIDAKDGAGLPGVSVGIKGTGKGALTTNNGTYKLEVSPNAVLVFSFIGYASKEVPVANQDVINVTLGSDNKELSEVVVTALGIKREKRTLGYASQEVKGDDIVQTKEVNFLNGLAGKVAGVQINNTSGMPGGGTRILIRGAASLTGNNQPLFVVDGNPISNDQIGAGDDDPVRVGGTTANRGIDIDPNIIESVNILRGASATALYGSRAAGGAVIITTKKGSKKGTFNIIAASSTTLDKVIAPKFQNQWGQGTNGASLAGTTQSWGPKMDTVMVDGKKAPVYDPIKMFFKTGTTLDNSLSLNGTTEKSTYLFSYSSLRQEGVAPNADYYRNSFYGNFSTHFTDQLKMTAGVNYIDSRNHRLTEGNFFSGYLSSLYFEPISFNPLPAVDPTTGKQNLYTPTSANNPFWAADNIGLDLNVRRVIPNVTLEYSPLNWLTFTERLGADVYTEKRNYQEAIGSVNGATPIGRMFNETVNSQQVNHDFFATGRKSFDKLDVTLMVGNNIISEYYTDEFTKGVGLSVDNFYDISNAESITSKVTYFNRRRVSLYAQAILEYNRMLSLTLTGRNDWSSALPPGNNSYFYPSATAAFVFSELPGLKNSKALSFGKLRVGYTGIGNDAKPYYVNSPYFKTSITDALNGTINIPFNGANAFSLNNVLGNPDLKPESIREFEVGLESKWLNNRIGLEVSYYNKVSKNLIYLSDVSGGSGYQSAVINAGKITNKGIEVTLNATPIQSKNVNWNISVNYSRNKSMINELSQAVNKIQIGGFTSPGIYLVAGQPYGSILGSRQARDAQGHKLVDDKGYPILDQAGDAIIGNIQPRWLGGVTNTVSFKGFDLSFTFDGRFGGDILNLDAYYLTGAGRSELTNNREGTTTLDAYRASDGKVNTTVIKTDQAYYRNYWRNIFENSVEDGTVIKLRNVTLAYTLSPKLLAHTFIKGATISVAGRNLWLYAPNFTGSDPELSLYGSGSNSAGGFVNFVSPSTRSYNATVKLTF